MKKGIGLGVKTTMISFVILIGVIVMGGLLVLNMYMMGKDMGTIKDKQLHHMTKALELADQLGDMQLALERYIDGDKEQKYQFESHYKMVEGEISVLGQIPETSKLYGELEQIRVLKETYYTEAQKIFTDFDPDKQREASATIDVLIKVESAQLEEVLETYKVGVIEQSATEASATVLKNEYISKINILGELIAEAGDMEANLVTFTSGGGLTLADFEEDSETFKVLYTQLEAYVEEDEKTVYETIGKLYTVMDARAHDVFNIYNPESKVQAEVMAQDIYTNTYTKINQHAANLSYGTKEEVMEQLEKEVKNMTVIMVILGVAISIVAILVVISAFVIQRVVISPIKKLSLIMQDIGEGEGNLTVRIPVKSKDEVGILIYYFNQFVEKIHHMVEKVIADTSTLYEASNQINTIVKEAEEAMEGIGTTIHDVTQRLQENASVVEETTASIQEIASSGTVVSEKTEEVSRSSEDVRLAAKEGESKLGQVTKGFTEVKEASEAIQNHLEGLVIYSRDIEQVLGLITGISDQVNLLALNASIEAARAGEYGLGFAVVAEEIRKLAEESRMSAVKIGGIINQVTTKTKEVSKAVEKEHTYISESSHIVAETEVAFNKIVHTVDQVAKEMCHVAEVVTSQSHATDEISQAINEMSVSTQENANAVTKMNDYVATQVVRLKDIEDNMSAFNQLFNQLMKQTSEFKV